MQHIQYGINSLSKFAIARRLALLRGTLGDIISPVPSHRPAPRHLPLATYPRLRFGPPADHARVINAFIVFYCTIKAKFHYTDPTGPDRTRPDKVCALCRRQAKFHYTGPTGPDRTRTDFIAARVSDKLRWVRAVPRGSGRVRSGPCSGIKPLSNTLTPGANECSVLWSTALLRRAAVDVVAVRIRLLSLFGPQLTIVTDPVS